MMKLALIAVGIYLIVNGWPGIGFLLILMALL